jgi:hypothetical protein
MNTSSAFIAGLSAASFWQPDYLVHSTWLEHAPFAFWLVEAARPRRVVELGVFRGYSYFAFAQAVQRLGLPATCCGVDTWVGDVHGGLYANEVFEAVEAHNRRHYAGFSSLIRATFDEAVAQFED